MKHVKLNFFEIFSLGWVILALVSLALSLLGIFYVFLIVATIVATIVAALLLIKKKRIQLTPLTKVSKFFLGFTFLIGVFLSFYSTPTVFEGRDEGSYSTSGIMIAENHNLKYKNVLIDNFNEIYGKGKALNFPGFQYTANGELKSQFLPAYPSWIATWYSLGGINALKLVNLFCFVTFVFSFYLIVKKITGSILAKEDRKTESLAVIGALLLLTSFPLIIFYKFTLSEIYFASLLWLALLLLLKYFEEKSLPHYLIIFLPLLILPFARIEAIAILFILLLIMILKDYTHLKKPRYQLPFVVLGLLYIIVLIFEPSFFINTFENFFKFLPSTSGTGSSSASLLPDDWKSFYLLKIFFKYNILPFLIMGGVFIIIYIIAYIKKIRRKDTTRKNIVLIPIALFAPTLIYLVDANISLDHPWMLRRFLFTIIPILILYTVLFLAQIRIKSRWVYGLIVFLLLFANLALLFPRSTFSKKIITFPTYSQNKNLLSQTKKLADQFSEQDLILVSQKSSGSGWSLMAAPMRTIFNKQAVYFFNPEDLNKVNKKDFENIYLITSLNEEGLYENIDKEKIKDYEINNNIILPSREPQDSPDVLEFKTKGVIYKVTE